MSKMRRCFGAEIEGAAANVDEDGIKVVKDTAEDSQSGHMFESDRDVLGQLGS
jgi:hypothetical protein